ncbi:XRE family transcriptional regulator [Romboutsia weinsteinii]|uniref:XRE family transcriptional regulator n=2 Tax=Romboutsia weinsteinii TaxID=2020949 RepID=A0A371IYX0_9FIRM|nr:XRE family transcriptional regulator [Romboutsia weinsteinii]
MKNMTFGQLLEKFLYLSNQKKSSLAKEVGYDISYISKWINSKNLPSTKNINKICKVISEFIVDSLTEDTIEDLIKYFEIYIDENENKEAFLLKYIERSLKDAYLNTTGNSIPNIPKDTFSQESYNSISHVNPKLRKKYLFKEMNSYINKDEKINMVIASNLFDTSKEEKMSLADMKETLYSYGKNENLKVKFLTGLKNNGPDFLFNTMLILNLISSHPSLDFRIYNCTVSPNTGIFVIKNKIMYVGLFRNDGICILSNMSKEKPVVDELYYSLEDIIKNQGNAITSRKSASSIIEDNTYMEYIMGHDLRWLIGNMNEFFMPEDLFMEVAEMLFGDKPQIINELKKINIFLQNVTYKSKLKVLIYESELRKYISSGELLFFNKPVTLTFKQRERHIKYIEKILNESEDVEIRLIDGKIIDELQGDSNSSLYLSRNLKLIKTHPEKDADDYAIIMDNDFKSVCNSLFYILWDDKKDIVVDDKEDILQRISKSISYTKIINENFNEY